MQFVYKMIIPFTEIVRKYRISGGKILHIGAHKCEERLEYKNSGWKDDDIVWIEGNPEIYTEVKKNNPDIHIFHGVVSDREGDLVDFSITNNTAHSSMMEREEHGVEYPWIFEVRRIPMPTTTISAILSRNGFQKEDFRFINIHIQGAELLALKGMKDYLSNTKYAYISVSERKMYKNSPTISEIDEYMKTMGFSRHDTVFGQHHMGDALYINESPKVTAVFRGGLGNRLFIMAAMIGYVYKNSDYMPVISSSKIEPFYQPQQRLDPSYFLRDVPVEPDIPIHRVVIDHTGYDSQFRDLNEGGPAKGNLLLDGYFQHEKYFEGVESWVYNQFKCPQDIESQLIQQYPQLAQGAFLHIRRTDTIRLPYPDLTKYYNMCASTFPDDTTFFICSDDIEWCKSNVLFKNMIFVQEDSIKTLWIMSLCSRGGLACISTYSWWAGWLNRRRFTNSIIFCPISRFNPSSVHFQMIAV